ncbi:MAG: adenylate/guanylate cyclase domain-containing protein, partial [Candidatus Fonsibacter sp.]
MNQVSQGISPIAEHHSNVTILFTDTKGFTNYSSSVSPHKLFTVLNSMYSAFDEIICNWAIHKVEIIGDAYFVSAGCPAKSDGEHDDPTENAMRAVEAALAMQRTLPSVCEDASVQMRAGLHTGSVVAGVVGMNGPRYHLFDSAVSYAVKMESNGIPGRVHISDATHKMLMDGGQAYEFVERSIRVDDDEEAQRTWLV